MKKSFFVSYHWLLLILFSFIISIPLLLPYFHTGYFPTHDGEWAVVRLGDMYREIKDLQFPARYSGNLNFGYGYPLFEFAYPLPYYLGFVIHLFHIDFVNSMKLLFALTVPFSFMGMYLLAHRFWNNRWAGYISGMLYIYYPYRLVDLFVRGSIGESIAFVLFPFILYFLLRLHQSKKLFDATWAGVCIALLVTAHNIMAVEFLPVILIFMGSSLFVEKEKRKILALNYLVSFVLGFGLSCFFWLPALSEKNLIALSVIPIADKSQYFVKPLQLLLPSWGYGTTNLSYQLGVAQILALIGTLVVLYLQQRKSTKKHTISLFLWLLLGLFIIYIFLLFSLSTFFWQHIPLFSDVTYPWTLLAPLGFMTALMIGRLASFKGSFSIITIFIIWIAMLYCISYAKPSMYVDRGDAYYLTNDATTTSSNEYTPLWVRQRPAERPADKFITIDKNISLSDETSNSKMFSVTASSVIPSLLQINTIYYPGWNVTMDGKPVIIHYQDVKGVMQVYLPKGTHIFVGTFTETPLRLLSDFVSLLSIFAVLVLLFLSYIRKRSSKAKLPMSNDQYPIKT